MKHVAEVKVSAKPRLGQVGYNKDNDVVEGIVIMLRGENPSEVIARLKDRIEELNGENCQVMFRLFPSLTVQNL